MRTESKEFLFNLLRTPSPTGFEAPIQKVVRSYIEEYAEHIEKDVHGNLIAAINPDAKLRVMLAGHCDQIGFMVSHISSHGFIYVTPLGGIDASVLLGAKVQIHTEKGPIVGVFGRKPIHMQSAEERARFKVDLSKFWIDIGAKNKKEVDKLISIGDPVTFDLDVVELRNDMVSAPGLDDKSGLFVVMETLRLCAKSKLKVGLYSVSTVQEEVGLRGAKTSAYAIDPYIGIAVDVTHATDNPGHEHKNSPDCLLGAGPAVGRGPNINPKVESLLRNIGKKKKIPFQLAPSSGLLGNDANVIQVSKGGVAAGTIQIPNRYMHTQVEVCSLKDLENSAKLLAEFVKSLSAKIDLIP